jgi:hypothetical protein
LQRKTNRKKTSKRERAGLLLRFPACERAQMEERSDDIKKDTSRRSRLFAGGGERGQKLSISQQCPIEPPAQPANLIRGTGKTLLTHLFYQQSPE